MNLKPYLEYKDSGVEWIGRMPTSWKTHRFKTNFKYIKGKIPENLREEPGEYSLPYLSMDFLRGNESDVLYSDNDPKAVEVNDGDLLLLWDGSNAGEFVEGKKGYLSSTMVKLNVSNIDLKYSNYLCRAFEPLLRDLTIGMGIPHVNGDNLGNIRITHPNFDEQIKITNFLDKKTSEIDLTIEKDTRLIELLKEKRTALINHVVTKGLDPTVKMKDSGVEWIGEISEKAEIIPFRRICNLNQGLQFPQAERLSKPDGNSKIYITIKYIHSNKELKEYIPNPPKRVVCKKNDVLLARTGATGEVVTDQEGVFHNNFFRINYDNSVNKKYLVYYLQMEAIKELLLLKAGVTTIPDLNHDDFLDTPFIMYPFDEQERLVGHLDTENLRINRIIQKIHQNIELLEEYKKSLIHHVVTGKVDVREVAV